MKFNDLCNQVVGIFSGAYMTYIKVMFPNSSREGWPKIIPAGKTISLFIFNTNTDICDSIA